MTQEPSFPHLTSEARLIQTSRVFEAPRERVFEAWSNPRHLAAWWGPNGFTNTFHVFEFKQGGVWRFTMHGPDGADYENENIFREVLPLERIVFQHLGPIHAFAGTFIFEALGNQTRLRFEMRFESATEYETMKTFITAANEQVFDRLAGHLKTMQ